MKHDLLKITVTLNAFLNIAQVWFFAHNSSIISFHIRLEHFSAASNRCEYFAVPQTSASNFTMFEKLYLQCLKNR